MTLGWGDDIGIGSRKKGKVPLVAVEYFGVTERSWLAMTANGVYAAQCQAHVFIRGVPVGFYRQGVCGVG